MISADRLGSALFQRRYGVRYSYMAGSMYKGIGSTEIVIRLGQAGLLGFLGTGGLKLPVISEAIDTIQSQLAANQAYGMNLLCHLDQPALEMEQVELFLDKGVPYIEAAAFMQITPALVRYRLSGLTRTADGKINTPHRIIAKVSRPEVASAFMSPAPAAIVRSLVAAGELTETEATLGEQVPMAHESCVESDSGGHTDQGVAAVLIPTIKRLSQEMMRKHAYDDTLLVGAAGGIGTPEAAAAAFLLGADFVVTGSINQCTVEAGTSDAVKDLLEQAQIQDTTVAPAGDMFEIGAKVQVLRRGLFFPARANKLYELYQHYPSLEAIDEKTQRQLQDKYFKRSFDEVWVETKQYYATSDPEQITKAEQSPKHKMALIFKWYFIHTTRLAMRGSQAQRVDYQIHCGPAMGAFNAWVKDTPLATWRNRHVDEIADQLMQGAAEYVSRYIESVASSLPMSPATVGLASVREC